MSQIATPPNEEMHESPLPVVPSPYEGKHLSIADHLGISSYWFATNFLWGAMLTVMLPREIEIMAPATKADTLGRIVGIAAVIALLVPLFAGAMSDRCASRHGRRRPYIAVGVAINIVGLALMLLAFHSRSLVFYGLAFMVVQFGNNVASAAYSGIIPDLVPPEQRGVASGYMAVMSQLGTLFGAFLMGMVLGHTSPTIKYVVLAAVLGGIALVTLATVKETPLPYRPEKIAWIRYLKSLWIDPREHPDFAWVWVTRALVMLGFYAVLPFVQYYLGDVIRVADPENTTPKLLALILFGSAISGVWGGAISDKIGRKKVVYVANTLIAVMAVALALCRDLNQALAVGMVFGLGYGAYISVDWALGTDVLPSKTDAAKDMAVWHIAMTLPQSIGSPIGGLLLGMFGVTVIKTAHGDTSHYPVAGYAALFLMAAACFALGAVLLRNVKSAR